MGVESVRDYLDAVGRLEIFYTFQGRHAPLTVMGCPACEKAVLGKADAIEDWELAYHRGLATEQRRGNFLKGMGGVFVVGFFLWLLASASANCVAPL